MRRTAVLLLIALTACAAPPAPVTVTVGGSGPGRVVSFSCPGGTCQREIGGHGIHEQAVTVPAGSTVRVDVAGAGLGPIACWITAADGRTVLAEDSGSGSYTPVCEVVAR